MSKKKLGTGSEQEHGKRPLNGVEDGKQGNQHCQMPFHFVNETSHGTDVEPASFINYRPCSYKLQTIASLLED